MRANTERLSRHYYDTAKITATEYGKSAMSNTCLLYDVRSHNLIAFRQAWKKFEKAIPGSIRLVPQTELRGVIETDYHAMEGMIIGEAPKLYWIMEQIKYAENTINGITLREKACDLM